MKTVRLLAVAILVASPSSAAGVPLEQVLGRSDVRVRAAAYPLVAGRTVLQSALPERLDRLGYRRVHARPTTPGEYFFGHETFWIYRRAHRVGGRDEAASLIGLALEKSDGMILGALGTNGKRHDLDRAGLLWLEPETLAESLAGDRADRILVDLDTLPDHVWKTLLAAEDARFFDHSGVDARALARAALANLRKGGVQQGGSTITQQLIKNRDLTPRRSLGRKASEALRALTLEAEYDKREILQAYLNQVYYGHVEGLAVHGIGAAARAFFSRPAADLTLAQAATLTAMIQGPNRLSPIRHPERARERRNWVLDRMAELGWADDAEIGRARNARLDPRLQAPRTHAPGYFLSLVAQRVTTELEGRLERGRGVVVETTLDPFLQQRAEIAVTEELERLRARKPALRRAPLSAALVALDAATGEVLAYVGGDPAANRGGFDRARSAERQPGSTVKPFVLLEALERCGDRDVLHPASRVADEPLRVERDGRPWEPENADRRYKGRISARTALAESRNVPMVRIARHCGWEATGRRFERAGLALPPELPPAFVLGAVETTPLSLAAAYTVLATPGYRLEPLPIRRVERAAGRVLLRERTRRRRVTRPSTAYLVRHMMTSAVAGGTASVADIEGVDVAAKTGSSSELRDAWFAGHAGSLVTVVWVGLDDGTPLGLSGSAAAGPIWKSFMHRAVPARPQRKVTVPRDIVEDSIDPTSGLRVRPRNRNAVTELFRRGALPPRKRFWRVDEPIPVVR